MEGKIMRRTWTRADYVFAGIIAICGLGCILQWFM